MAPKYQIFNTPEETKSNQIVSRAELISMQITCNRCLNLSTKWEWICRAKTKFKTKTRVEYLKLALMHACSKGSINSDVMITLSLFATLSPFGMHFSLSFVYMWWYSISHRWIYTVWCMDSRHLQTGKLYEEIEIIIGSDGFCCSHAHVLHSHSHTHTNYKRWIRNHVKPLEKLGFCLKHTHTYRKPLKMIFKFLKGCDWVCLLNPLTWWQSVLIWISTSDSGIRETNGSEESWQRERERQNEIHWLQWW